MGDDVLRQFAETVRQEIRFSDKLVRWGGEEFLLVCRDASEDIGLAIKRADVALYQAKSNGRNRVELA